MKPKNVVFTTVAIMVITLVLLSCGTKDAEFDWPRWRGPNGDGISNEANWNPEALSGGPKILWRVDVGMGHSNVAIKDNRLYTMGVTRDGNTVVCLNADTGEEIWRYSFESSHQSQSTATTDGKFVYTLNTEGILLCLKARNGKLRWKKDLVQDYKTEKIAYGYSGSPVVEGDLIILNVNTAGLALNKNTGEVVWKSNVHTARKNSEGYYATPVIYKHDGIRCALILSGTGLFSVEAATGKKLWYHEFFNPDTANVADPELFQNMVLLRGANTTDRSEVIDISGEEPQVVWQNKKFRNDIGTCVLIDGYLYGSDDVFSRLILRCIEFETGEVMWEEQKMKGTVSLIAADNKLIILEENGTLYIAKATPSSYKEISSCQLLSETGFDKWWTPPVLCNGRIYCRNYAGDLVCIDVSK